MTESPPRSRDTAPSLLLHDEFVESLLQLSRGHLAELKRNAGHSLGESRNCMWFYDRVPFPLRKRDIEYCFLVATLAACATRWLRREQSERADRKAAERSPQEEPIPYRARPTFGTAMAKLKQSRSRGTSPSEPEEGVDPIDRRFGILLDSYIELQPDGTLGGDLPYRLRQLVRLADAADVEVDWARLLFDVLHWEQSGKRVQKDWARDYYDPHSRDDSDRPRRFRRFRRFRYYRSREWRLKC